MNYIFLGATKFSEAVLNFLIENKYMPKAIFYIPEEFKISWSNTRVRNCNYADLSRYEKRYNIPCYEVNSENGKRLKDYIPLVSQLEDLELILVMGWYYMVPKEFRSLAKYGSWGVHASLLPRYAGGAPLVWAIINGEKETGVTLFKLDDGVDDGDIIAQEQFPIDESDTIKEVYEKALQATKNILLKTLTNIENVTFIKQDKSKIQIWPQRKPEDGVINWNSEGKRIYDFIRAQTLPYPCAFSFLRGTKIRIVTAKLTNLLSIDYSPGKIVLIGEEFLVATRDYFVKIEKILINDTSTDFNNFINNNLSLIGQVFK